VATRPAVTSESREVSGASATGSTPAPSGTGVVAGEPLAGDGHPDLTPTPGAQARISALPESLAIPAGWLDRLLTLACDLPHDQGEAAVIRAIVAEIQVLVPALRVAVRPGNVDSGQPSDRHALWTEPPQSDEQARSGRLFPTAAYERSASFPGGPSAGSIHFASDDDIFRDDGSPHVQLMERVAVVTAHALARVHEQERASALRAELRTVKLQMVQAEKLASLGQIAAGMVHELNNPLTSIAAYTDYLLRRAVSRTSAPGMVPAPSSGSLLPSSASELDDVERLRRIAESADRMLRFTRDLISYARPSTEIPIAVQIHGVIDRALAFCEHEVVDAGVVVQRSFSEEVGTLQGLRGLPEQLAQVFVNLVTNACHAMVPKADAPPQRPAVLTITTALVDGVAGGVGVEASRRVMVVLEDTGCGIAKANLPHVFTPFFTTKGAGRGTGLGLSIVKNIVDTHRGEIRVESDTATGTRFVLLLPVDSA